MKIARVLLAGILGLAILAAAGLAAALAIIDGQFVKTRLERAMHEKHRTLRIEGVPALRLFPVAGVALGKASLSEPGSDKIFVALDSAEVAVRVLPLLSGELAIEALKLSGLKANIVRRKDGTMNFSDLTGASGQDAKPARHTLRLAGADVDKVHIAFRDEASGQELDVVDVSLKAGRLDGQTPGDLTLSLRVTGKRPEVDLRAQAAGALSFNLRDDEFAFDKFTAQLKGRVDQESVAADFSAPKVAVTPARASGSEMKGSLQMKGPQHNFDLSYTASVAGPPLAANLVVKLDESTIRAKIELPDLAPLKANVDLNADRLNLDRYFPPERRDANPNRSIDLSALKGKTVNGKLAVGALTYRNAKLENVKAELRLAGGKLQVAPHSASLYGGSLAGELSADADGNKFHVKETVQNVAVGALLRDVTHKDFIEGRGNLSLDVQSTGGTVAALKKALAGNARVDMKEGSIKGVNLAEAVHKAKGGAAQKTEFSDLSASLKIANGVARNDDLKAHSPLLRLSGAGNLDIGNNGIDYLARATLAGGVGVPVKVYGALDNPSYSVDYTSLAGGVVGGTAGAVTDTVKKGAGSIADTVRSLFRR
jgi:AsmA protein